MGVELVPVGEQDKAVLANLLQFYCYDFSAVRGFELTPHGTFVYRFLDHYFIEAGRGAFLVRHGGYLAGFVLVRALADGSTQMAEFFVVRAHRRRGVGREAARLAFASRPGRWEVAYDTANAQASAFWPGVVAAAAAGPVERSSAVPPERAHERAILRFTVA